MNNKVYIVEHCANESCCCDFIHEILGVYDTLELANERIEHIKECVSNKTSPYFKDKEYGWIAPTLEADGEESALGVLRLLTYQWENCESGAKCYTKFYIKEHDLHKKQTWTRESLDKYVEDNGGETFGLLDCFPFSEDARKRIADAYEDEDNFTDSDICDLILELAYKEVG